MDMQRPAIRWAIVNCVAFLCAFAVTQEGKALAQNLLTNGSFESPGLSSNVDFEYLDTQPTLITGWTVTYDDIPEPSYYLRSGHSPGDGTVIYAADGQYLLALSDGDSLSTTFSSIKGQQYAFSYFGAQPDTLEITVGNLDQMEYSSDGNLTDIPYDNQGYYYSFFEVNFTATSAESTLTLYNVENNTEFGNFGLDNLSVVAVPEPTSIALIGVVNASLLMRGVVPSIDEIDSSLRCRHSVIRRTDSVEQRFLVVGVDGRLLSRTRNKLGVKEYPSRWLGVSHRHRESSAAAQGPGR